MLQNQYNEKLLKLNERLVTTVYANLYNRKAGVRSGRSAGVADGRIDRIPDVWTPPRLWRALYDTITRREELSVTFIETVWKRSVVYCDFA